MKTFLSHKTGVITLFAVLMIVISGCSIFGIRTAEELKYDVLLQQGQFELRKYSPHLTAQVSMEGSYDEIQGDMFRILASYIFGKNNTNKEIAMTAPVVSRGDAVEATEKIAMTAPVVLRSEGNKKWMMSFSMPNKYSLENLPRPVDERIKIVKVPTQTVAVLQYSGLFSNIQKRMQKELKLLSWLEDNKKFKQSGKPFYAGYDPPFTIPFLRRNEVLVPVEKTYIKKQLSK